MKNTWCKKMHQVFFYQLRIAGAPVIWTTSQSSVCPRYLYDFLQLAVGRVL